MRFIQCKKCFNLINDWCEKVADSPHPELTRDCEHYRVLTNGDALRRLTDSELTSFILRSNRVCPYAACIHLAPEDKTSCHQCWRDWLGREIE